MPEAEILIAENSGDILRALLDIPETRLLAIAAAGRSRALAEHSSERRAAELETLVSGGKWPSSASDSTKAEPRIILCKTGAGKEHCWEGALALSDGHPVTRFWARAWTCGWIGKA